MKEKIGRNVPPPRDKNAPKLLVTKYGALPDDASLPDRLEQDFVAWVKNYRTNFPILAERSLPDTRDALVVFWKRQISAEYVEHAFDLADKIP